MTNPYERPRLTGRYRYRKINRWFNTPVIVLQVEWSCYQPVHLRLEVDHYRYNVWRDASWDVLENNSFKPEDWVDCTELSAYNKSTDTTKETPTNG